MTNHRETSSRSALSRKVKFFRTGNLLILAILVLVVAAVTATATAQTYTDLYNFDGLHGSYPSYPSLLTQGRDGSLYGTIASGGSFGLGVVFKITPNGTLTVLYNFDGGVNGGNPTSGLTLGTDGNFYGTTGGGSTYGTIFRITKSGSLTTLYTFTVGGNPWAPPIQGADGNLYGVTASFTVYKITPSGTFTVLGSLPGVSLSSLVQGTDGNFYGATTYGGSDGDGTVFKVTPRGTVSIVYNFDVTHGQFPFAPLIQGTDGNFYGTTWLGGTNDVRGNTAGVVFKLTPQGAITVLHDFADPNYPNDGFYTFAGLIQASDGNFYGVTADGFESMGVIFRINSDGAYSVLYDFDSAHGQQPFSTPIQHTNGRIYGLADSGGTLGYGVVYRFDLGLTPFVSLVSPAAKAGKTIGILGQGFTGTTGVSFNGTAAAYDVVSSTYLTTTVPPGVTTGPVTVTTPSGTLTSNQPFRVLPALLSFSPSSGPVGTSVTITGLSLTQTEKISFGGAIATAFTVNSDTQVTATVPAGAKTGSIQLNTLGGQVFSQGTFTVTE